jgi:dCMP deaminase
MTTMTETDKETPTPTVINWDARFLELASHIASWSKDPSTRVGAVIVSPNRQILSIGYNGFPRGIDDSEFRLDDRPVKYSYTVHAEMNAIYNATLNGVSLAGSSLYVSGLPVCSDCALGIIQVGISRVIMPEMEHVPPKWGLSFVQTSSLFEEAGVEWSTVYNVRQRTRS